MADRLSALPTYPRLLHLDHYKVEKNETASGTTSKMRQLNDDERVREIAQMLSGSDVSEAAIQNAKELLKH